MFNDDGAPISLFSFQDIITSLTGIMIFFLLLLSLNILEVSSRKTEISSAEKELALVREQNKIHQKHIQEISEDISSFRMRGKAVDGVDEAALIVGLLNLKKQLDIQKQQLEKIKQKFISETDALHQAENESKILSEKASEIVEQLAINHALEKQIREKKRKIEEMRKAIKKKKNFVSVTIDSNMRRRPILVECASAGIKVYDKATGAKKIFLRDEPIVSRLVSDVIKTLKTFPVERYYFVFLVKPSSVSYINYLISNFQSEIKNAVWGMEPVRETEGCTNE